MALDHPDAWALFSCTSQRTWSLTLCSASEVTTVPDGPGVPAAVGRRPSRWPWPRLRLGRSDGGGVGDTGLAGARGAAVGARAGRARVTASGASPLRVAGIRVR